MSTSTEQVVSTNEKRNAVGEVIKKFAHQQQKLFHFTRIGKSSHRNKTPNSTNLLKTMQIKKEGVFTFNRRCKNVPENVRTK